MLIGFLSLLLRAPALIILRAVAHVLVLGPLPLKMAGWFILATLGLTAGSEESADDPDPFGPNGDPSGNQHAIELPPSVERKKEAEIPVPRHWIHRNRGDVALYRVPVGDLPATSAWPMYEHPKTREPMNTCRYLEAALHETSHQR